MISPFIFSKAYRAVILLIARIVKLAELILLNNRMLAFGLSFVVLVHRVSAMEDDGSPLGGDESPISFASIGAGVVTTLVGAVASSVTAAAAPRSLQSTLARGA